MSNVVPLRDSANPTAPASVSAAATGSQLGLLVALRDKIAAEIDAGVQPAYLAALVRQMRDLAKEIEALRNSDSKGDDVSAAASTPDDPWAG